MQGMWRHVDRLSTAQRLDVLNLLNRVEVELSREALDEGRRRVVVHGWPGQHWLCYDLGNLVSYALAAGSSPCVVEQAGGGFDSELLEQLFVTADVIEWWLRDMELTNIPADVVRTLKLFEIALPVPVVPISRDVTMRAFEPGKDNEAWIQQNNLAFADHPEQGTWNASDLEMRIAEPWFDPSGFLLFEDAGEIVASCWTKVHELHPDRFGEIYVISVHPNAQGRGLGRLAVTQGLNALRRKGVSKAQLFVDDTNSSALALYEHIGFRRVRDDHLLRFSH